MEKMGMLDMVAWWLVVIGALNWGLVGAGNWISAANWNVVEMLLGSIPPLPQLVYILVGLSGLYMLYGMLMMKK